MANENQKKDPTFKPADLTPGVPVKITLKSAKPVATGVSKHGDWNLWTLSVDNVPVVDRETGKTIPGYSGDAVCFPSDGLHKQFLALTNGTQENVKVELKMEYKKGKKGPYTSFEATLVEGGTTPPSNLSNAQYNFVGDFRTFVTRGVFKNDDTLKEHFINMAISSTYQIPLETAEKLWIVFQETNK